MMLSKLKRLYKDRTYYTGKKSLYTLKFHERFNVSIKDCVNAYALPFNSKLNPITETARMIIENQLISYNESPLADYYERFQPSSLIEALRLDCSDLNETEINQLESFLDPQNAPMPWTPVNHFLTKKYIQNRHDYGPKKFDSKYGEPRFKKILMLCQSIQRYGYKNIQTKTELKTNIRGILLKKGNEYRFLVFNGNHRVGVLAALGHDRVPVIFNAGFPSIVDYDQAEHWPCVKKSIYSVKAAQVIFESYFKQSE